MPLKTVTTAGTRVQLSTTSKRAARITLQRLAANTGTIYVGLVNAMAGNTGASVASSAYDAYLDASNPSITFGMGETGGNPIDANMIYLDTSVNGEGVAYFLEAI
jgi:hypothetical protein